MENDKLVLNDPSDYIQPNKLGKEEGTCSGGGDMEYPKIYNIFQANIELDEMKILK